MKLVFWRKKNLGLSLAEHARQASEERYRELHPELELMEWLEALPAGEAKAIRCDAGWTQGEVAKACGITSSGLVGKWERGSGWSKHSGVRYARLLKELAAMRDDSLVHERSPI